MIYNPRENPRRGSRCIVKTLMLFIFVECLYYKKVRSKFLQKKIKVLSIQWRCGQCKNEHYSALYVTGSLMLFIFTSIWQYDMWELWDASTPSVQKLSFLLIWRIFSEMNKWTMKILQIALNLLFSFSIYGLQIVRLSTEVIVRKGLI